MDGIDLIPRAMRGTLLEMAAMFPAVTLTGPRQSGKSTLVREAFPDYAYVSLEDPDMRELAQDDPRAFLTRFDRHVIFDEAQRVPELFSYMQAVIDRTNEPGRFIISGSQNFLLLDTISQSLAGRVGILHLLPLSRRELADAGRDPAGDDFVFDGGYPRLYSTPVTPQLFFPNYVTTYVDRDVRSELGVRKIEQFNTFLTLCATRVGEVLNLSSLANDCDVSAETARSWLSMLEASFLVLRLQPYHRNYGKRLIRSPKMYFYDTGLASNLLGLEDAAQLLESNSRGNLFENAVVVEIVKQAEAQGRTPKLYFWRDSGQKEIDLIVEKGGHPWQLIEIKSSTTYRPSAFATLTDLGDTLQVPEERRYVVYGGTERFDTRHGHVVGLDAVDGIVAQR